MIHGVYLKNKPKSKWHLVCLSSSFEKAKKEEQVYLDRAKLEGFEEAESAIQYFESSYHIPEYLSNIKEQKILLN